MSTPAADRTGTARCTDISHSRFRTLLIAGLLIRLLALPLEGTEDVLVWKTWSYGALNQGLSRLRTTRLEESDRESSPNPAVLLKKFLAGHPVSQK